MIRTCEDCGKDIGVSGTICSDCYTARKMKNAKKIKFKDYDGDFIYNDTLCSNGEFEDMYKEEFAKDSPKMVYATKISYKIGLDIEDELRGRAEDNGYEDMEENLDLQDNPLLIEAQRLIDEWVETQGGRAYSYSEDMDTVVDLTELYNEEISKTQEDLIKEAIREQHGEETIIPKDTLETLVEYIGTGDREFIKDVIEDKTRVCGKCNTLMLEGYVENDGDEYYCSEKCILEDYKTVDGFFEDKDEEGESTNYWTDWGLGQD